MSCIFTHTKHVVHNFEPRFSACLLCYALKCVFKHAFFPLNCIQIRIVRVHWMNLGRKLIIITISKSWMKKKKSTSPFWIGIARKQTNDELPRHMVQREKRKFFDFLQMSNDHYRNKFQKETRKSFHEGGENRLLLLLLPFLQLLLLTLPRRWQQHHIQMHTEVIALLFFQRHFKPILIRLNYSTDEIFLLILLFVNNLFR